MGRVTLAVFPGAPHLGAQSPRPRRPVSKPSSSVTMRRLAALAFIALAALLLAPAGRPLTAQASALAGVVVDTSGTPIAGVEVLVPRLRRHGVTNAEGRFVLGEVTAGVHRVSLRRLGYRPLDDSVRVGDGAAPVRLVMTPVPYTLPPQVVTATSRGLFGTVGDTAFAPLAGAEVQVMGQGVRVRTDTAGRFHVPLRPGSHMVRVRLPGYRLQAFSVNVPADSGRDVSVWLLPLADDLPRELAELMAGFSPRWEARVQAMSSRVAWRSSAKGARFFTREDIDRLGVTWLHEILTIAGLRTNEGTMQALVDGGPKRVYVDMVAASELEAVEVYPPGSQYIRCGTATRQVSMGGSRGRLASEHDMQLGDCGVAVIIWMRY